VGRGSLVFWEPQGNARRVDNSHLRQLWDHCAAGAWCIWVFVSYILGLM
jgi:hypothetical protein